jgi:adenylate cyclase
MPSSKRSQDLALNQDPVSKGLSEEAIRAALHALLSDPKFKSSDRNRQFLKFVVEEMLAGRSEKIKSYSIAVDVFGRNQSFDPTADPIVRIEATRLRSSLAAYYTGPGKHHRVRINLPKGGYVPTIEVVDVPNLDGTVTAPAIPETGTRPPIAIWITALAILLGGLGAGTGYYMYRFSSSWNVTNSVVLLEPGISLGDSPAETQKARGLDHSIVGALTRFQGLQVILLDDPKRKLEVIESYKQPTHIYLIKVSSELESDKMRVSWNLSNARSGKVIWSEETDGPVRQIDNEIASRIAIQVGATTGVISTIEVGQQPGMTASAYGCVLRARGYYESYTETEHADVRTCLEETVAKAPNYSDAWAMLAFVYNDEDRNNYNVRITKAESSQRALAAAERSVALAPNSDLAQEALMDIQYRRGNFAAAEAAGRRALSLNPNNPEVKAELGIRLFARGNWDEGAAMVREAAEASFFVPALNRFTLSFDHYRKKKYSEALQEAEKIDMPGFYGTWMLKAAIYGQLGRAVEAQQSLIQLQNLYPNYDVRADLGSRHYTSVFVEMMAEGLYKASLNTQTRTGKW